MGSKITAAAQSAGVSFKVVRDAATLAGQPGSKLVVDLNQEGALDAAAAWRKTAGGAVVGFVSHVDADTIARARQAHLDQILARSQFVARLQELVTPP